MNKLRQYVFFTAIILVLVFVFTSCDYSNGNSVESTTMCSETNCTESNSGDSAGQINDTTEPEVCYKPIIYLYPKKVTELTVKLGKPENLICTYPDYSMGWNITANPNGIMTDNNTGRKLYSLYWESINDSDNYGTDGFVVKGSNTVDFLEEKLSALGLNELESEEFIIYWLPKLQSNEYNFIRFATAEEINEIMPLEFSVTPDTIIRILMQYKPLNSKIEVAEQTFETPERNGFVAVEWGGMRLLSHL